MTTIDTVIDTTLESLGNSDYTQFDFQLNEISQALTQVSQQDIPTSSDQILRILNYKPDGNSIPNLRLYRGLLLLVRNMAPLLDTSLLPSVISSFHSFIQLNKNEWIIKTITIYWQILANFKRCDYISEINEMFQWARTVCEDIPVIHFYFVSLIH